ncbi:hypothetical protein [Halococcus salsus]|uniref:hypothetical protein n=1 Tax=Halococcus salsus TaxID=2162894 RepID=UPI00135735DB|nr:hypothetical protein [Halococcus salsus]
MAYSDRTHESNRIADGGEPQAPASVPKYVREGVEAQDSSTLREIAAWCEELADYREQRSVEVDDEEELVDVENDGGDESAGTTVIKKVPCGKENCSTCPHGPYEYRVHREGKDLKWEYIGPVQGES